MWSMSLIVLEDQNFLVDPLNGGGEHPVSTGTLVATFVRRMKERYAELQCRRACRMQSAI